MYRLAVNPPDKSINVTVNARLRRLIIKRFSQPARQSAAAMLRLYSISERRTESIMAAISSMVGVSRATARCTWLRSTRTRNLPISSLLTNNQFPVPSLSSAQLPRQQSHPSHHTPEAHAPSAPPSRSRSPRQTPTAISSSTGSIGTPMAPSISRPAERLRESGTTQSATRTYSTAGQKTVKVVALNDQGAQSSWSTRSFTCTARKTHVPSATHGTARNAPSPRARAVTSSKEISASLQANAARRLLPGNNLVNSCTGATIQTCVLGCASGACVAAPTLSAPSTPLLRSSTSATPPPSHGAATTPHPAACTAPTAMMDRHQLLRHTSSPIQGQTIYTLHCIGVSGSNPSRHRQDRDRQHHSGVQ